MFKKMKEAFGMSAVELGAEDQGSCRLIQHLGHAYHGLQSGKPGFEVAKGEPGDP